MLFSTRDLNHFDGAESVTLYPKIIPNMLESTMNYGLVTTAGPLPLPPPPKKKKKKKEEKIQLLTGRYPELSDHQGKACPDL